MSEKDCKVNFFTPKTDHARANMKVVTVMIIIWAVAVFGFQVLLIFGVKPVAEESMGTFEKVWPAVKGGTATVDQKKEFAKVNLMVLGKNIALKDDHKAVLVSALNKTIKDLLSAGSITDPEAAIGLGEQGYDPVLKDILKSSLNLTAADSFSEKEIKALPEIMKLYLVHNRSKLTDTRFLGFPFHYWYTSQFLLILFVALCWIFCKITDKSNAKYNLETETE